MAGRYPAPGYRDAGNYGKFGVLALVGNRGYSWSRSVSGTDGFYLDFGATWLGPSDAYSRAFGFQVRCLQE